MRRQRGERIRWTLSRIVRSGPPAESGMVLVMLSLMMVVLLGFAAMVTDAGLAFWHRWRLQNAMDAAALAGAQALPDDPDRALAQATTFAQVNGVTPAELAAVTEPAYQLHVFRLFNDNDAITVSARRRLPAFLRAAVAAGEATVATSATAAVVPFQPTDLWPLALTADTTCQDECPLKLGAPGERSGNFGAVAFPGNRGADDYRRTLVEGYRGPIPPPSFDAQGRPVWSWVIDTEPGNMAGPTRDALDLLFSWDAQRLCDGGVDACRALYARDGCTTDLRCPRVGLVPRLQETWDQVQGRSRVTVVGFVCVLLTGYTADRGGQGHLTLYSRFQPHCRTGSGVPLAGAPLDATGLIGVILWR